MATGRPSPSDATGKRCFVTIGATAPFDSLVRAVLEPAFLQALQNEKYTQLRIQYGNEGNKVFDEKNKANIKEVHGIDVTGFDFNKAGLREEMNAVKGGSTVALPTANEGMIISHAGSGSILEAMRLGVPLVVVPNTDLLHNHQMELAEVLAEQKYVVHGKLDDLGASVSKVEEMRKRMRRWPPVQSGTEKYPNGLGGVMAEEMGWLD